MGSNQSNKQVIVLYKQFVMDVTVLYKIMYLYYSDIS